MGAIRLEKIEKWFGNTQVIKGIDLTLKMVKWWFLLGHLAVVNQHYFA